MPTTAAALPIQALPTELRTLLETHDSTSFESYLDTLFAERQQTLFRAMGRLTRDLHQAMAHLNESTGQSNDDVPTTREHLREALAMSADAAHQNLALAERLRPQASRLAQAARRVLSAPGDIDASQQLGRHAAAYSEICLGEFTRLVEAQSWQDLTGQRLKQVAAFIDRVDGTLLELARLTGTISGNAPGDESRPESMSNQNEVDRLLSEFGF